MDEFYQVGEKFDSRANYELLLNETQSIRGASFWGYHCPPVQQPYWNTVHLGNGEDSSAYFPDEELFQMIDLAYEIK